MNIGLYFGSFNPIHNGHLIIANYILQNTDLDKVWFVVTPLNPHKQTNSLLQENNRLHLVRLAIEGEPNLKASNIEFSLPKPNYTIDTLTYLQEKYDKYQFTVIMGSDSYTNIKNWKNYEAILANYKVLIYERPEFILNPTQLHNNSTIIKAPLLAIASTQIRKMVKLKQSIRYWVPAEVQEEIQACNYYTK